MLKHYQVLIAVIGCFVVCVLIIEDVIVTSQNRIGRVLGKESPHGFSHGSTDGIDCGGYIGSVPDCSIGNNTSGALPLCHSAFTSPVQDTLQVELLPLKMSTLEYVHAGDLQPGGLYQPQGCQPLQRVAIVVPYHDRLQHLKVFLNNLHPFLKTQGVQYMIIVVEQALGSSFNKFNRGMMKNIGYVEGEKICKFDCYVFHDIDLIPEVERNIYTCDDRPRHHSANLARWNHTLPYPGVFGGVVSFKRDVFKHINGYSNAYFGWGGEDDDLYWRITDRGFSITRYPLEVSKYKDLAHEKNLKEPSRWKYFHSRKSRMDTEGLNSLKYRRHFVEFKKLYTWVYVEVSTTEVMNTLPNMY